ncbi:MAG: hypothetical protein AAGG51_10825 [Cyanobacteria bacterium P01_G01_bin.54]
MPNRAKLTRNQIQLPQLNLLAIMEVEGEVIADIKDDELYDLIQAIARYEPVHTLLEIGSFTGQGSTEAFVTGLLKNPHQPHLFCIEAVESLFTQLNQRYRDYPQVHCYCASTVATEDFPTPDTMRAAYEHLPQTQKHPAIETLLAWLEQDRHYLETHALTPHIIPIIQNEYQIKQFDVVLIDGSEFTGAIELEQVYGAHIIILDDINTLKNHDGYQRLMADPDYMRMGYNPTLRNGYATFYRLDYLHKVRNHE